MTAEHTKGPWHVGREADHSCDRYAKNAEWARIRDEQGGLVAKVESVHPKGKRQSSDFDIEADRARLIAAAPELLFAVKCLQADLQGAVELLDGECPDSWRVSIQEAEAAIAKATKE